MSGPRAKRDQELTVITKTYDLVLWTSNHVSRFPRNHRFGLGVRIEGRLYELLETLIRAKYTRQKKELLEGANLTLEILRFQMRLAKDLQCLRASSYGFAAKAIDEIGRFKDNVRRFRRRVRSLQRQYAEREIGPAEIRQRLMSWSGHARQADTHRLRERLFAAMAFRRAPEGYQ